MNLNKLLCEYMDDDEKGYVTVGDVAGYVIVTACYLIFAVMGTVVLGGTYLYGAWRSYHAAGCPTEVSNFGGLSVLWFAVISLAIIGVVGACVVETIAPIRVATCERKERDE